ncbi:MAG: MFS transporter [Hyphomonadaceae bacterium]|nr:MFS transporter [Hyphomonadaceae bacterium]
MADTSPSLTGHEEAPLRPLTRVQMWLVAFALVSMGVGMTISFVVASPLAREAGLTELQVAGLLTASAFIYAYLTPAWGRLANRVGRKRIMVFALYAMAICNTLFIFALDAALKGLVAGLSAFLLLAIVRMFFGLLAPGLQPAALAAITDATTPRNRAAGMGLIGAAISIGSILGPAGAAVLAEFGPLAPIWGSVVFSLIAGTVLAFSLPPTRKGQLSTRPSPLKMTDPRVRPHLLFLFCYFIAVGAIQQTLAWLVQDRFGFNRAEAVQMTGLIFASMAVMLVFIQFGYVARRKPDPLNMLPIGLSLVAAGYILALMPGPYWLLALAFAVIGSGAAQVIPAANALATLSVSPAEQGAAAALVAAAPPAGFVVGPLLGAGLYMLSPVLPLTACTVAMGLFLAYTLLFLRRAE